MLEWQHTYNETKSGEDMERTSEVTLRINVRGGASQNATTNTGTERGSTVTTTT